jgi:hypothetical protein
MSVEDYVLDVARRIADEAEGDLERFRLGMRQAIREDPELAQAFISLPEDAADKLMRAAKVFCDARAGRELLYNQ